jgi:dihydroorotate dehydrogenase
MLGFSPDPRSIPGFDQLGVFITNPISLEPRTPAALRCAIPFNGGVLLHSGYPNPGLGQIVKKHARVWSKSDIPIILHLMADDLHSMEKMIRILENVEGVSGLELSFAPECKPHEMARILQISIMERPVIAQLDIEQMKMVLPLMETTDLTAVSMMSKRGSLPLNCVNGETVNITGRLFGPSLFPQALLNLEKALSYGFPVIVSGGIMTKMQVEQALISGAYAVQLDTVLWGKGVV